MIILKYICLDIGGTTIKHALADETGQLTAKAQTPSRATVSGGIVDTVLNIVKESSAKETINGVAIATAGLVDENDRVVFAGEHFADYSGTHLSAIVEENCHLPCTVINDANAAALGEYWLGVGKGSKSMFMITVGTGVGGALIIDGHIVNGSGCSAGEIGFIPLGDGVKLEDVASGSAMTRQIAAAKHILPQDIGNKQIATWIKNNDETTLGAIKSMCRALSFGIATVCCLINPEVIVLGGGAMENETLMRPLLNKALADRLPAPLYSSTRLEFATLQNDAGAVGALKYFLQCKAQV